MTLFSRAGNKFQEIKGDEEIPTEPFLLACSELLPFIELMGPIAFKLPKADLNGHIQRILTLYNTDSNRYATLQKIVTEETEQGNNDRYTSCTRSLLWITRTLEFTHAFLNKFISTNDDLTECVRRSYEETLKKHHGWIIRGVFHLLVRAVPTRKDFVTALKADPSVTDEELEDDIKDSMTTAKLNIDVIYRFYRNTDQNLSVYSNIIQFRE